jgi:hypothetical protein
MADETWEPVIIRYLHEVPVRQWPDGSWDGAAICKAYDTEWEEYWRDPATQEFVDVAARSLGMPRDLLVRTVEPGPHEESGMRIHRRIAYDLAGWLRRCGRLF